MKLQTLTIIFIIIMLPITMVVSQYIKTEISTINTQTEYDTKLANATYDAIKAFQLNESNSTTQNITTEKMRDVQASISSFYNSLASSMGVSAYTEKELNSYIPCLVYTLYDGYYIYTKNNTTGEYELKPYVYYTEHLSNDSGTINCTVSYTLDSYIIITYTDENSTITKSGYLYSGNIDNNDYEYLTEDRVYDGNSLITEKIPYVYKNLHGQSTKYYYINNVWYSRGTAGNLVEVTADEDKKALGNEKRDFSYNNYTNENRDFTDWVKIKLSVLKYDGNNTASYLNINKNNNPDEYSSAFNEHRRQVIQDSIKSNIQATLISYNNGTFQFQMPELDETEWDKIINNVSLISFMQGLPLKNKLYRGYSVVTNTQSKEFVNPNEIYVIQDDDNQYHKITWKGLNGKTNFTDKIYRNVDFNEKSYEKEQGGQIIKKYYLPHNQTACYESIISSTNVYGDEYDENGKKIKDAIQVALDNNTNLKQRYYMALYRERYVNYKSLNFGT